MNKIELPNDSIGVKWRYIPEFGVADTSSLSNKNYITSSVVSTTTSANTIAEEINRRVNQIYKEREKEMDDMTYCGKPVVDISPGVNRAYIKFMDNILAIDRPRELIITHESMTDGVTLELKCDEVHSHKLYDTNDVRIYNQNTHVEAKPDVEVLHKGFKTPKIKKDGKWFDLAPKKVIFSGPATTILWKDGTKTTVKCQRHDIWADDVGIAMCYLKKMLGNKGNFNNIFREAMKVAEVQTKKEDLTSSTAIEGDSYYSSALDSMKRNIDEINDFMKDAADALDKALGGKK